jgi:preprotein translocase subunit SecG
MILTLANVIYVLVAVAMIALILLQRGAGAAAGSGFGAGASATVFGARGASNFLSKSTAILAAIFFILSLGMAMYATKLAGTTAPVDDDLGLMSETPAAAPATFETPAVPVEGGDKATPSAPAPAPAASQPPAAEQQPAAPAPASDAEGAPAEKGG